MLAVPRLGKRQYRCFLLKRRRSLNLIHGNSSRGAGDDAAQRDAIPAGPLAALYF
jgi:hypothetical protein